MGSVGDCLSQSRQELASGWGALYSNKFNLASGGEAWIKHTRFIRGRLEMKDIFPEN